MYCNTGAMPPGMELETPEFNKSHEYPEALYVAIKSEDKAFQFPKEEDMKHAKQYRSHYTSTKRSHGGS